MLQLQRLHGGAVVGIAHRADKYCQRTGIGCLSLQERRLGADIKICLLNGNTKSSAHPRLHQPQEYAGPASPCCPQQYTRRNTFMSDFQKTRSKTFSSWLAEGRCL